MLGQEKCLASLRFEDKWVPVNWVYEIMSPWCPQDVISLPRKILSRSPWFCYSALYKTWLQEENPFPGTNATIPFPPGPPGGEELLPTQLCAESQMALPSL